MEADYSKVLEKVLINALSGTNAHLLPYNAMEGLTLEVAGRQVTGSPYTIWQLIKHLNFWQERFSGYLENKNLPPVHKAAHGWPVETKPENAEALKNEIDLFNNSIESAKSLLFSDTGNLTGKKGSYESGYDVLQAMASHISYHIGEIMVLRRILGDYPPPSGGDTW